MLNQNQIEFELKKLLALDFNCKAGDFDTKQNVIVVPEEHPGRRIYLPKKAFFFHGYYRKEYSHQCTRGDS